MSGQLKISAVWHDDAVDSSKSYGEIQILEQTAGPKFAPYKATNGVVIESQLNPQVYTTAGKEIFYVRGSRSKDDNQVCGVNDYQLFRRVVEAVAEHNEVYKVEQTEKKMSKFQALALHRETWELIADGKSKKEAFEEVSRKYDLRITGTSRLNRCFLCEYIVQHKLPCKDCLVKWEGDTCQSDGTLYDIWGYLKFKDNQKASAIARLIAVHDDMSKLKKPYLTYDVVCLLEQGDHLAAIKLYIEEWTVSSLEAREAIDEALLQMKLDYTKEQQ